MEIAGAMVANVAIEVSESRRFFDVCVYLYLTDIKKYYRKDGQLTGLVGWLLINVLTCLVSTHLKSGFTGLPILASWINTI